MKDRGAKALALATLVLFVWFARTLPDKTITAEASGVTSESIKQKENEIANAKKERQEMNNSLTDLKKVRESLQQSKNDLNAYVKQLDGTLAQVQDKITVLGEQIEEKKQRIADTEADLEEALRIQEDQYESMKQRIRFMYERGNRMPLEMLIDSGSFTEMLNKAEHIYSLSAYDRGKLDEYMNVVRMVNLTREALEEEKATLDEAIAAQEQEEKNLQSLITDKTREINSITADIHNKEAAIKEYESYIAQQNAEIAALEKAVAADKAALAAANARKYDGGIFTWPCPNYTRLSSDYGNRVHPTLGVTKFHSGIDLAAPAGSPILAAYAGTVVAAAYSSSMGNYVMINHGSGLYTVYMHASKLYVSAGQSVNAGAQIAAVGTTGRSTGNHLHFSVRKDGSYVSPWNYLK